MPEIFKSKEKALQQKMRRLGIFVKDIDETFIRSSGPGGQNVNKVSTCVILYHRPTRTRVKCQGARTQAANRFAARRLLVEKVEQKKAERERKRKQAAEKKRRQARKRSQRGKEQMLEKKKRQSERKKLRKKVDFRRLD